MAARCDDHDIGIFAACPFGSEFPLADGNPQSLQLIDFKIDERVEIFLPRGQAGEVDLSAQPVLFVQDDLMSPERRDTGRLQTGRSAAGDEDLLEGGRRRHLELVLAVAQRIDRTGNGAPPNGAAAGLVAADAEADLFFPAFPGLDDPFVIGEYPPADADEVRLALLKDLLGMPRGQDPVGRHDRNGNGIFHRGGQMDQAAVTPPHAVRGRQHRDVSGDHGGGVGAEGDAQCVDAGGFEAPRGFAGILDGESPLPELLTGDPAQQRVVVADQFLALADDLHQETQPPVEIAPVGILPLVREGGKELLDQVKVGTMKTDGIETGLLCPPGRPGEFVLEFHDLVHGQLPGDRKPRDRRGNGRGGNRNDASGDRQPAIDQTTRLTAGMADLDGCPGALGLDGVGKPGEARDVFVVVDSDVFDLMFSAGRIDHRVFDDDQGHAAAGNLPV